MNPLELEKEVAYLRDEVKRLLTIINEGINETNKKILDKYCAPRPIHYEGSTRGKD